MRVRRQRALLAGAVREIVFGLEDSLVSTLGATAGVAVGSGNRLVVILTGLVLVAVEAISMAAGSYLSTKSAEEISSLRAKQDTARLLQERVSDEETFADMLRRKKFSEKEVTITLEALGRERKLWLREVARAEHRLHTGSEVKPGVAAVIMGISYIFGGVLVFLPYILVENIASAALVSVGIAVLALFGLGVWKARLAHVAPLRSGAEMVAVSLVAGVLGVAVGRLAGITLGT